MNNLLTAAALLCAGLGALADVRVRRIPNRLTYSGLGLALALQAALGGAHGLGLALAGAALGGGVLFLFFLMGGMGAGDVKLMAAIGAFVGPMAALLALVYTALAGAVLAVGAIFVYRRMPDTVSNLGTLLRFHAGSGLRPHAEINLRNAGAIRIPYGLAIAAGTLVLFLSR